MRLLLLAALLTFLPISISFGQDKTGDKKSKGEPAKIASTIETIEEETPSGSFESSLKIGDAKIPFTAKVDTLEVAAKDNKSKAKFVFTQYLRSDVEDVGKRAVTFCFNGGPGSASLWLHLGGLSPKRIEFTPNELRPKDYEVVANPYSILDHTDLIFIDPISTGYSRPEKEADKKKFHGYQNDVASVGEFVREWLAKHGRWRSPKYVLGESYGGIRGVALSSYLWSEHSIALDGLILVSPVIDFQTIRYGESNDLPYVTFLPSFAATAWFHKKVDRKLYPTIEEVTNDATKFATGEYALALLNGDATPAKKRKRVIEKMSVLTGLSPEYIDRANLRVSMFRFGKELLRDENRIIGRFDGRFSSHAWDENSSSFEFDPSGKFISGAFADGMRQYYFSDFGYRAKETYKIFGSVHPWEYSQFEGRYVNVADKLRTVMTQQPNMRVLFTLGYTDLATPFLGSIHTINHLGVAKPIKKNISVEYYPAGHMMYLHVPSQVKLKRDLDKFYKAK